MRAEPRRVELNGGHGEGGGALLRTALQMAALTQLPVSIHNVRGAMRKPGLNAEDLTFILALGESCGVNLEDHELGADRVEFSPAHPPRPLRMSLDVHSHDKGLTPGSACVVAHSLLPVLARAGAMSRMTVYGETHGANVLGYDSFEHATLAAHRAQGIYAFPSLVACGFGYGARGQVNIEIEPSALAPFQWQARGPLKGCGYVLTHHGLREAEAEAIEDAAAALASEAGLACEGISVPVQGREPGASLTFWARFEKGLGTGAAVLGRSGSPVDLATSAWRAFRDWLQSGAVLDQYLADQVLLPACFADGKTSYTTPLVTRRLATMTWVIKQFLPIRITIHGREGEAGTVTIER